MINTKENLMDQPAQDLLVELLNKTKKNVLLWKNPSDVKLMTTFDNFY